MGSKRKKRAPALRSLHPHSILSCCSIAKQQDEKNIQVDLIPNIYIFVNEFSFLVFKWLSADTFLWQYGYNTGKVVFGKLTHLLDSLSRADSKVCIFPRLHTGIK